MNSLTLPWLSWVTGLKKEISSITSSKNETRTASLLYAGWTSSVSPFMRNSTAVEHQLVAAVLHLHQSAQQRALVEALPDLEWQHAFAVLNR